MRYLRDLARARREPILDVAACPQVHWLAELPDEVYVETDAGPGDVLFSVPVIPITPPAALSEFDSWLALRRWYRALRTLSAEQHDGERELVLATGLLTGAGIHNHLLTTPVRVVIDPATERADVVLLDRPAQLHDKALLESIKEFRAERIDWVREAVEARQGYALQDSTADVLRKWCAYAFDDSVAYRDDWADEPSGSTIKVRLAPALVLRERGRAGVLDFYDAIIADLQTRAGGLPAGLVDFLTGPNPAPRAERLALLTERTEQTLADLVTTLLAGGRRVLVATQEPDELRTALPETLTPLCASPATAADSMSTLAARFQSYDPERHEQSLRSHESRLANVQGIIADLKERAATLRAEEVYDLAPGYRGTHSELVAQLADRAPRFTWLPQAAQLPPQPPLTTAEASELLRLLADQTPRRAARPGQQLPDPATMPTAKHVREMIGQERAATDETGRPVLPEMSGVLARCDPGTLARLATAAAAVTSALGELGLPPDPARWDEEDWAVRALRDGMARRTGPWEHIAELSGRAMLADRAMRYVGSRKVVLPQVQAERGLPAAKVLHERAVTVRELRDYVVGGGAMHRGLRRSPQQKAADAALNGATVDGSPPTTPQQLDAVLAELECRAAVQELVGGWQAAGVVFPAMVVADGPPAGAVAAFSAAYTRLGYVRTVLMAVAETASLVFAAGVRVSLATPQEWQDFSTALAGVRLRMSATRATAALAQLEQNLEREIRRGREPPELRSALAALKGRDAAGYEQAMTGLAEAHGERLVQARCDELMARIHAVHPALAAAMAETPDDSAWGMRLADWEAAWTWAYASAALRTRARSDLEVQLEESLAQTEERQAEIAAALTAGRAWGWTLSRMTATGRPPGPGAPAPAAAVPAWAIPMWQIPEVIPARPGLFDVVVVDQGTAEDVEALFLLWPAPRVIFVGGPTTGTSVSVRAEEDEQLAAALAALPPGLAAAVRPASTLLEALNTRLGPVVRTGDPVAAALAEPTEAAPRQPEAAPEKRPVPSAVRPGRSIAEYKRNDLVELIARVAKGRPQAADDDLVAHARDLLDCPADEELLTTARLRYALGVYREEGVH